MLFLKLIKNIAGNSKSTYATTHSGGWPKRAKKKEINHINRSSNLPVGKMCSNFICMAI